jgi:hypothetical protein
MHFIIERVWWTAAKPLLKVMRVTARLEAAPFQIESRIEFF